MGREESIATDRLGTVEDLPDGNVGVRFERMLDHSVDDVWAAITDVAQLAVWFPELTLKGLDAGSVYELRFGGDCDGPPHVTGTVVECTPKTAFQLGTIRYELSPVGAGCQLVFSDVLMFDAGRTRADVENSVLAGWHDFVDRLDDTLAGKALDMSAPELDYAKIRRRSDVAT